MLTGIESWWSGLPDAPRQKAGAGLIAAALLGGTLAAVELTPGHVERQAQRWLAELHQGPQRRVNEDERVPPPGAAQDRGLDKEHRRVLRQIICVRHRMWFHAQVVVYFYARYYMALTIASVAGLLSAAMLVVITRAGWGSAGLHAKTAFFVAGAIAAHFAAFPGVFQQSQSITDNLALYTAYGNMEHELLTYLATGETLDGKPMAAVALAHATDRRLAELNRIPIGFDASKLPSGSSAFKGLGSQQ